MENASRKRAVIASATLGLMFLQMVTTACATGIKKPSLGEQNIMPNLGAENNGLSPEQNAKLKLVKESFLKADKDKTISYFPDNVLNNSKSPQTVEKKNFIEIFSASTGLGSDSLKNLDLGNQTEAFIIGGVQYVVFEANNEVTHEVFQMYFGSNDNGQNWSQSFVSGPATFSNEQDGLHITSITNRHISASSQGEFNNKFGGLVTPSDENGSINLSYFLVNPSEKNVDAVPTPPPTPTIITVDNGVPSFFATPDASKVIAGFQNISFTIDSVPPAIANPPIEGAPATAIAIPLNVAPEVKTVLDAQKAPYMVNALGEAVITVDGKEVTLKNIVDTKTDFGLAEDILNGPDKDTGIRYLFTEKGGWAKVIEAGTPENRTKVNYEDFANGVVNASAALLYQENPTIPADAIDPQWWLQGSGSQEIGGYIGTLSLMPTDNNKLQQFTRSTKSYGAPTLWLEFNKDAQGFVTVVQPNKNPDKDNGKPDQKINMNWTFDKDRFDQKGEGIDDLANYLLNDKVSFQALIAPDSSRGLIFTRLTNLAGIDGIFSTPNLQKPGEQLSFFSLSEQSSLKENWYKRSLVPWGDIPNSEADISVSVIPPALTFELLTAGYIHFTWGDIQP